MNKYNKNTYVIFENFDKSMTVLYVYLLNQSIVKSSIREFL